MYLVQISKEEEIKEVKSQKKRRAKHRVKKGLQINGLSKSYREIG